MLTGDHALLYERAAWRRSCLRCRQMLSAHRFDPYHIVAAGVVSAASLMAFEMLAAGLTGGVTTFARPVHGLGALVVGNDPTRLNSRDLVALVLGVLTTCVLSVMAALMFAGRTARVLRPSAMVALGMLFGAVLWMAVMSVTPFDRVASSRDDLSASVQFVGFVVFYGLPLGWYLARNGYTVIAGAPPADRDYMAPGALRRRANSRGANSDVERGKARGLMHDIERLKAASWPWLVLIAVMFAISYAACLRGARGAARIRRWHRQSSRRREMRRNGGRHTRVILAIRPCSAFQNESVIRQ